ncbi:MAG TPA: hypothetical protein VF047_08135, partial [Nitrososphaeraceae archaeon]
MSFDVNSRIKAMIEVAANQQKLMLESATNQLKFNLEGISNQQRIFIETNSSMFKTVNPEINSVIEKAKTDLLQINKNVENEM